MLKRVFQERFSKCTAQRNVIGLVADAKRCFDGWLQNMDE